MSNVDQHDNLSKGSIVTFGTRESKRKVAVIGYGILGLIAVEFLDRDKFEVHVFDLDSNEDDLSFFPEPTGPKSLMHPKSSPIGSPGNFYLWGRAITNCIKSESHWSSDFLDKVPELSSKLVKYGFPKMPLQVHNSAKTFLKINHANMNRFRRRIKSGNHQRNIIRHYALVSGVALMNGFVKVRFQSREGIIDQSDFDYVIVCAGPINTFNLVSKSGLIGKIESADYFDHPTTLLGIIKTKKFSWFYSRLQNKRIVFGNKPGAIVFSIEEDFSVTIRVRPDSARHLSRKQFNFLARILRYLKRKAILFLGIFISRNFSVAISLDLSASALRSVLQKDGVISELCYSSFEPKVNFQLLKAIDDVIGQNFGAFEKTWENETSFFEETPAAHYSGFLGSLKNDKNESILDGFRLRGMPQISLPGSVSFPGPVIGHPTYLALLSLLYEVQRINGIHFDD